MYDNTSTESDLSVILNDFRTSSAVIPAESDHYIYIASELPFNHRFILIDTANDQAATLSVQIWFAKEWKDVVDLLDQTALAGVTLAQSGILSWKTDRNFGWDREQDSEDVTGVEMVGLYNMYWCRIGFSATIKNTTALKWIGHRFCTDDIMYSYYPDLNNDQLKTAFAAGKTTWDEQHYMAGETIVRDIQARGIAWSANQILDWERFEAAAAHKAAAIIYSGMDRAYVDDTKRADDKYNKAFNIKRLNLDKNANATLDDAERGVQTGFFRR
jgi:hypothetical protein